jgi:hypothetical protein
MCVSAYEIEKARESGRELLTSVKVALMGMTEDQETRTSLVKRLEIVQDQMDILSREAMAYAQLKVR